MPLSDVLFQDDAQAHVQRALRSGRLPHAYLFAGPPGVGKEMLATRLAQAILCSRSGVIGIGAEASPPVEKAVAAAAGDDTPALFEADEADASDAQPSLFGEPSPTKGSIGVPPVRNEPPPSSPADTTTIDACGCCVDCTLFAAGTHPDFHRIHRMLAKHHPDRDVRNRKATMISVDVIRHFLLNPIGLRPSRGRAKVFIVVEAERLSDGAQNAMLKTLEEPPGDSYLILLAASADSMLATTRSRCQRIGFGTLPTPFIVERLTEHRMLDRETAQFFAELTQGSLGMAQRYLELGVHDRLATVCAAIQRAAEEPLAASKSLQDLAKEMAVPFRKDLDDDEGDTNAARDAQLLILAMIATVLRDVQRTAVGAAPVVRTASFSRSAPLPTRSADFRGLMRAISAAEYQVSRNAHSGLIFDTLAIALNRAGRLEGVA